MEDKFVGHCCHSIPAVWLVTRISISFLEVELCSGVNVIDSHSSTKLTNSKYSTVETVFTVYDPNKAKYH